MGTKSITKIQEALKEKGFDPGEIDGIWGRNTIAAVKHFQQQKGLTPDGIVGPRTTKALFGAKTPAVITNAGSEGLILPWYEEAKQLRGTKEIVGNGSNPVILDWADDLDIHYPNDDIPWCGLFVAHCIGATLPQETLPGNPLGARQWEKYGDKTTPGLGAVMVFWRKSKTSGLGHVGFYSGEDKGAYRILGGNQSNSVSHAWISKDRFLSARWPRSAAKLTSTIVERERQEKLSSNED
jgi:uncharacterized protein (TIGR02594 family)